MEEERHRGMVRSLTRNMICFFAAVLLLALMFCALEVSLRGLRLQSQLISRRNISQLEELVVPSRTSWIDVQPLVDLHRETGLNKTIRIQTNEHGIRGPSVVVPKPRGTYRIICLGGDNVFGSEMNEPETLPNRLQRTLNMQAGLPVEVINAGCPNAGPLINLLRYRSHLSALQPDLVVFCLSEEDLGYDHDVRGALHLDHSRNPAYASHPGLRGQGSALLDGLCQEFLLADWLLSWAGDLAGMQSGLSKANAAPVRESIHRDIAAIVPLSGLISGNFGHLVISISPSAWSVDRARNAIDRNQSSFAGDVRAFLNEVHLADRIEVQDGFAAFLRAAEMQTYFSPQSGGLSVEGNQLYAKQLADFLLETIPGLGGATTTSQNAVPPAGFSPR